MESRIQTLGEEAREHLKFHWPLVQGTQNNLIIKKVGEQTHDPEKAARGFAHLLEQDEDGGTT